MRRATLLTAALAAIGVAAALLPGAVAGADDSAVAGVSATPAASDDAAASPSPTATDTSSPTPAATASPSVSGTPSPAPSTSQEPPVAVDDAASARWGSTVVVDVLANDWDPDGDELTVVEVTSASLGVVALVSGEVTYRPNGSGVGEDQFGYTISDGQGGEASATVTVQVAKQAVVRLTVPAKPHALRTYTLRGRVVADDATTPRVRLLRKEQGQWQPYRWVRVDDQGRFSAPWQPRTPRVVRWSALAVWPYGEPVRSLEQRSKVVARLDARVTRLHRDDLPHTWRAGCPVGPAQLRAITMTFRNYHGKLRRGTLISSAATVGGYKAAFSAALRGGFLIKKMFPVDRYGGSDVRSMAAGNTSAFNCRHVTGNPYRMSQHSYGNAIDINPFENPYATSSRIYPKKAAVPYYYRRAKNLGDPGVMTSESAIVKALWARGWYWGARWSHRDYQHWSSNGG